jgi:uncharacterized membrane-anchored protein YhcB (DUF1043 family)
MVTLDWVPKTFESWIYLIAACFIGFFIGRWIHKRQNKTTSENEALIRMVNTQPKKRISKKERVKAHRSSQSGIIVDKSVK